MLSHPVVIGLLGEVRIGDGVRVPPGHARALLGLLALTPQSTVKRRAIVSALWPADQPPSADHSVSVYAHRLRSAIADEPLLAGLVVSGADGYALDVKSNQVDTHIVAALVSEVETCEKAADRAWRTLNDLWRGEPFADLMDYPVFAPAREMAWKARATVATAVARQQETDAVIAFLEPEVHLMPWSRDLWAELIRAVYLTRNPDDAHDLYRQSVRHLRTAGLSPDARLHYLEAAVLRRDDASIKARGSALATRRPSGGRTASGPRDAVDHELLRRVIERVGRHRVIPVSREVLDEAAPLASAVEEELRDALAMKEHDWFASAAQTFAYYWLVRGNVRVGFYWNSMACAIEETSVRYPADDGVTTRLLRDRVRRAKRRGNHPSASSREPDDQSKRPLRPWPKLPDQRLPTRA